MTGQPQSSDFDGRAGFVTGGGSGIGRATAVALARAGAHVVVADVADEQGLETVELIREERGVAEFARCDVTSASEVAALVARVLETCGRLDFAHNNAGVPPSLHALHDLPEATFDRVIAINLKGVWLCLKYALQAMYKQRAGSIVNTASVCGERAAPMTSPYNAAKHGVIGLTKEAAAEAASHGIRVNAICPGYTTTPMSQGTTTPDVWSSMGAAVPLGRVAEPQEIAEAVVWLLSDRASYVNGCSLVADGGLIQTMPGPRDS